MDYLPLVFDGVLILVFVICIFVGRSNGFMKSVLSFLSIIISFAVAQSFSAPVAAWANESFAYSAVNAYVETYLVESSSGPARKYYHITPEGLRYQEAGKKEWEQFVERTGRLL